MAKAGYQPVPHDAVFREALVAKSGVKKAFDVLKEEYTALQAKLDARQAAGLPQADVASHNMEQTSKTLPSRLTPSPKALQKALVQSAKQAQRLADAFGLKVPTIKAKTPHNARPAR